MTVYDCFMFNNEMDLLELRLEILSDVVDRFVLVEARQAHTGIAKPLHFLENRTRYARWADRISHIIIEEMPAGNDAWAKEKAQRSAIARGLPDITDDDIVLISDADELPRRESVERMARDPAIRLAGFRMPLSYLRFNYVQLRGADPVYVWGVAARGEVYRRFGPQGLRDARTALQKRSWDGTLNAGEAVFEHAGWHFSYLGDDDHVRLKLASFVHQEYAVSRNLEEHGVDGILARGLDLFGRPGFEWVTVQVNDYFPEELRRDLGRYRHLLVADPAAAIDPALSLRRDSLVLRRLARS